MTRDEIIKLFNENSDSVEITTNQALIPAMTMETFIEVIDQLQNKSSNSDYAKCIDTIKLIHAMVVAQLGKDPDSDNDTACFFNIEMMCKKHFA